MRKPPRRKSLLAQSLCGSLLALTLTLFMQFAHAIDTEAVFPDNPELRQRYDYLIHQLRCLQCRSETIADSNATLAADFRRQVRESLAAGKSNEEILKFMTDRYGDYVLYNPPFKPLTWLLWSAPVLLILIGGTCAGIVVVRRSHLPDNDSPDLNPDELDQGAS
ncbi:MAG TPA: cytochrome c-type biogenesis protein [Steroidobacteraceae bacterium]